MNRTKVEVIFKGMPRQIDRLYNNLFSLLDNNHIQSIKKYEKKDIMGKIVYVVEFVPQDILDNLTICDWISDQQNVTYFSHIDI